MPGTLYSKLSLTLFALLVVIGLFLVNIIRSSNVMYQQEVAQQLNAELAQHIVAEQPLISDNQVNRAALEHVFHMLMVINPSIEIYLLDEAGTIIGYDAPDDRIKRTRVDMAPVRQFLAGEARFPLAGDDPRSPDRQKVFSAARIPDTGPLQGYLYVILGGEHYEGIVDHLRDSYIFRTNSWVLLVALLVALLTGLFVFALLTRRLRRLNSDIRAYTNKVNPAPAGQDGIRPSGDEIDRLDYQFRRMAERIDQQLNELERTDGQRRELVANISHDIRTPLTNLQGYLETLGLKDANLSAADRKRYLDTALQHCQRLTQLVNELFELAKLDSCERIVYTEPFSLSELTQDVVQKFQLKASEQKIDLIAECGDTTPMVYGDIGMLQRVLENLIDNGLRHTPPGGRVTVGLSAKGEQVIVKVADTGCGIPTDKVEHIFDRFYRGDSTADAQQHAGLGLAITRRILELHGSRIEVRSHDGEGTTFTFQMAAVNG
jgi:signal transduction histidine kinase